MDEPPIEVARAARVLLEFIDGPSIETNHWAQVLRQHLAAGDEKRPVGVLRRMSESAYLTPPTP